MQGTRISFRSKEDAIHFAEKQGATLILVQRLKLTRLKLLQDGTIMCA